MACECITKMDEALKERNARVDQASIRTWGEGFDVLTQRVRLSTVKIAASKRRAPFIVADFCPFCGVAYLPPEVKS